MKIVLLIAMVLLVFLSACSACKQDGICTKQENFQGCSDCQGAIKAPSPCEIDGFTCEEYNMEDVFLMITLRNKLSKKITITNVNATSMNSICTTKVNEMLENNKLITLNLICEGHVKAHDTYGIKLSYEDSKGTHTVIGSVTP